MEPEDEGQGCGANIPAQEVDLSPLAAAASDLESPQADNATGADEGTIHENSSPNEGESAAGQDLDTTDITASPHSSNLDPQVETSPQTPTDITNPDFPDSPTIDKGKQPQEACYTPGLVAMDDSTSLEAPLPLSSPPPDISSVHITDHFPDPSIPEQCKQPQQFYYSSDPIVTEASSSSTAPPPPVPDVRPTSTAGLAHGQPVPWELDPERPAQKLPIRFKDSLGRTMLIPWRRAKTWDGMKMTIDAQFMGLGADGMESVLGNAVANGRYSLHVSLPSSVEPLKRKSTKPATSFNPFLQNRNGPSGNGNNEMPAAHEIGSNFNHNSSPGGSNQMHNNSNNGNSEAPASHMRPMIILPEFWDELIQPGSYVSMAMWPRIPLATYDMVPHNIIQGIPPPNHGVGMMNQPPVMPPMAPLPPRIFRVIDPRDTRPKTRPSSGRPRKRV